VKFHDETPLNNEYALKNERKECKTGPFRGWILVEEGRVNGEGEYG
jgi:hypothetical protein